MISRKFNLLTGFVTDRIDRVCVRYKKKLIIRKLNIG